MMPNPNELQRLDEEYAFHATSATDLRFPKGYREEHLREARKLERELGIPAERCVKV